MCSGEYTLPRTSAARFTQKHYEYDPKRLSNALITNTFVTSYDRCKANRRCNWGVVQQDQYTNDVVSMTVFVPVHVLVET